MIGRGYMLLAAGAVALVLVGSVALNVSQRATIAAHRTCVASIEPGAKLGADPRKLCDPIVADRWAVAVRALTCDEALSAKPAENTYGIGNNCSAAVKRVHAERDTARAERDTAEGELTRTKADQAAAIRRAEADAIKQAERKSRAAAAVQSAPRTPAGNVVCDAVCLRARRAGTD